MPSAVLCVVFLPPGTFRLPTFSVGAAERLGRHSHAEHGNENPKIARCRCYSLWKALDFPFEIPFPPIGLEAEPRSVGANPAPSRRV